MAKGWKIIVLLGQPYVLNILTSLSESPKRFVDLHEACPNERTRTEKLRILKERGLIETTSIEVKKRSFVHYRLTDRGKKVLGEAAKMEKL